MKIVTIWSSIAMWQKNHPLWPWSIDTLKFIVHQVLLAQIGGLKNNWFLCEEGTFWDPTEQGEWLSLNGVVYKWSQTVMRTSVYSTHWHNIEEVICCFDQYQRTLVSVYNFPPYRYEILIHLALQVILRGYTQWNLTSLHTTHELLFCYKENKLVLTLNFDNSPYSVPGSFTSDNSCWYED